MDFHTFATVREGKLTFSAEQAARMREYLTKRADQVVRVTFTDPKKPRSLNQNSYMWGVVYQMIAEETGHTTEEVHEFCKWKFLPREFMWLKWTGGEVPKSTTTLSTKEMEDYLTHVRSFAAAELGIRVPLPNEVPDYV